MQKTAIIIMGMHRSGTSSVAGVLSRLGAAAPATPMEAATDNPRGFFESRLIGELNDRILQAGGSWWSDWRRFDPEAISPDVRPGLRSEIVETVRSEFGEASLIVLKDPRLCRLWPVWDGVLEDMGYRVVHVLPLRSPLEVAGSLKARNGTSIAHGLALWLRHVLDAETVTRDRDRRLIRWSAFMRDWRAEVETIAQMLEPEALDFGRAAEIETYLSRDLQHEAVMDEDLATAPETHAWAVEAYGCLLDLADDKSRGTAQKRLDRLRERFEVASDLFGRATGEALNPMNTGPELAASMVSDAPEMAKMKQSLEGLKALLAQERAARARLVDDHSVALQAAEVAATVERERRIMLEERLRVSMQSLVAREVRIKALI